MENAQRWNALQTVCIFILWNATSIINLKIKVTVCLPVFVCIYVQPSLYGSLCVRFFSLRLLFDINKKLMRVLCFMLGLLYPLSGGSTTTPRLLYIPAGVRE